MFNLFHKKEPIPPKPIHKIEDYITPSTFKDLEEKGIAFQFVFPYSSEDERYLLNLMYEEEELKK